MNGVDLISQYDQACALIAGLLEIDEAKDFMDKAEAIKVYSHQAKNRDLEVRAAEIRIRAERRLGELLLSREKNRGGRPPETSSDGEQVSAPATLEELGVDRKLASSAQALAKIPDAAFEGRIASWRSRLADTGRRVAVSSILKAHDIEERRRERVEGGGCTVADLVALRETGFRAGAILADPGWLYRTYSDRGEDRSAGAHYTTNSLDDIKALPVGDLAADDAVLFLCVVDWGLDQAWEVVKAWDFKHVGRAFVWAKTLRNGDGWHMGLGHWTRSNPEDVWLCTRGNPKRLNADVRELMVEPIGRHSEKPDELNRRIERLVDGPYLELNARRLYPGWVCWGDEIDRRFLVQAPAVEMPPMEGDDPNLEIPQFLKRAS